MYVAVSVVADRQTHRSTTITLAHALRVKQHTLLNLHALRVKQHTLLNLEQMLHTVVSRIVVCRNEEIHPPPSPPPKKNCTYRSFLG